MSLLELSLQAAGFVLFWATRIASLQLAPVVPDAEVARDRAAELALRELAGARALGDGAEFFDGISLVVLAEAAEVASLRRRGAEETEETSIALMLRRARGACRNMSLAHMIRVFLTFASFVSDHLDFEDDVAFDLPLQSARKLLKPGSLVRRFFMTIAASMALITNTFVSSDVAIAVDVFLYFPQSGIHPNLPNSGYSSGTYSMSHFRLRRQDR
eukprot:748580-Hanusia_phi.AAC.2